MRVITLPLLFLLLSLGDASSPVCPVGYTQLIKGGDCFLFMQYYMSLYGYYEAKSHNEGDITCNGYGGGLLASIRSKEETNAIVKAKRCMQPAMYTNTGLRCTGTKCKWDDGSPVTYTNFYKSPADDGQTRCYSININSGGSWNEVACGVPEVTQEIQACWACRVKARTIDCAAGETEYKGGCVSVHATPADKATAEASCPGGGYLISIHSETENTFYKNVAANAGISGTIYIGGHYSGNTFEWTDGSYTVMSKWANNFPNAILGSCVQMLLSSELGVAGQWTNIDCSVKQAYMCFRDGSEADRQSGPKADPQCPSIQYFTENGPVYSPNYPLSIPGNQSCEYVLAANEGFKGSVKFPSYDCRSGATLSIYDGLNAVQPFATFTSTPPSPDQAFTSSSNVIKIVFSADATSTPVGTGWQADFTGLKS